MKRFRDIFLSLNIVERISFIVGQICAIFVIIFGILQITNVWENSITICEIFLGILMITQAIFLPCFLCMMPRLKAHFFIVQYS